MTRHWDEVRWDEPVIELEKSDYKMTKNQVANEGKGKECPHCGFTMVRGDLFRTRSAAVARKRGWFNGASKNLYSVGGWYYSPDYLTIDHKITKSRVPSLTFKRSNLECVCWACNQEKGNNNAFDTEKAVQNVKISRRNLNRKFNKLLRR